MAINSKQLNLKLALDDLHLVNWEKADTFEHFNQIQEKNSAIVKKTSQNIISEISTHKLAL